MRKNILILYITEVSGHHSASIAIEQAIRNIDPQTSIMNINSFNFTNPILERIINRTYMGIIRKTPEVWDFLYDNQKVVKSTRRLRGLIHKFNSGRLNKLIDSFNPNAIVCTQAFPCGMVADYKKSFKADVPLIGVLTDYAPHSYWIYDNVDFYVVPSDDTASKISRKGIDKSKIKPFGIPINPSFLIPVDKDGLYRRLGLKPGVPIVLIMGGGQGLGPIEEFVLLLNSLKTDLQVIVVAGTNKRLYERLKRSEKKFNKTTVILGFCNFINELMSISAVLVTKAGGITTAEALAKELPMLILSALPGQESMNAAFLLNEGAALKADGVKDGAKSIEKLLADKDKLSRMRSAAKKNGKPDASFNIGRLVMDLTK